MFSAIRRLFSKIPGLTLPYYKIFFPFYRNYIYYLKARKYNFFLEPKSYSSKNFYHQLAPCRRVYLRWEAIGKEKVPAERMRSYVHEHWQKTRKKLANHFLKGMNEAYLRWYLVQLHIGPDITGKTAARVKKLDYILSRNDSVKFYFENFIESRVGKPILDFFPGSPLPMTSTSLDHIFYLARIVRELKPSFKSCLELGGGYGSFARIVRLFNPKVTYLIIDLPEVLPFQYLFHILNFPEVPVVTHFKGPIKIKEGAINLIPIWLIEEIKIKPDVFFSTYALTETTKKLREEIARLNFFDARSVYIVGGKRGIFKSHIQMQSLVKEKRKKARVTDIGVWIYEIMAH